MDAAESKLPSGMSKSKVSSPSVTTSGSQPKTTVGASTLSARPAQQTQTNSLADSNGATTNSSASTLQPNISTSSNVSLGKDGTGRPSSGDSPATLAQKQNPRAVTSTTPATATASVSSNDVDSAQVGTAATRAIKPSQEISNRREAGSASTATKDSSSSDVFSIVVPAFKFVNPAHPVSYVRANETVETSSNSKPKQQLLVTDVIVQCHPIDPKIFEPPVTPPNAEWVIIGAEALLLQPHPPTPANARWVVSELSTSGVKVVFVNGSKIEPVAKFFTWDRVTEAMAPFSKKPLGGPQRSQKSSAESAADKPTSAAPVATNTKTPTSVAEKTNKPKAESLPLQKEKQKASSAKQTQHITLQNELEKFYKQHNPAKIKQVKDLVAHFHGDRDQLNEALFNTYEKNLDTQRAGPRWVDSSFKRGGNTANAKAKPVSKMSTEAAVVLGGVCGVGTRVAVRKPATPRAGTSSTTSKQGKWADGQVVHVDKEGTIVEISSGRVLVPHVGQEPSRYIVNFAAVYANMLRSTVKRQGQPQAPHGRVTAVDPPHELPSGQFSEAKFHVQYSKGSPNSIVVGTRELLQLLPTHSSPEIEQLRRNDLRERLSNFYRVKNPERLPKVPSLTEHFKHVEKDLNQALRDTYQCDLTNFMSSPNRKSKDIGKAPGAVAKKPKR